MSNYACGILWGVSLMHIFSFIISAAISARKCRAYNKATVIYNPGLVSLASLSSFYELFVNADLYLLISFYFKCATFSTAIDRLLKKLFVTKSRKAVVRVEFKHCRWIFGICSFDASRNKISYSVFRVGRC